MKSRNNKLNASTNSHVVEIPMSAASCTCQIMFSEFSLHASHRVSTFSYTTQQITREENRYNWWLQCVTVPQKYSKRWCFANSIPHTYGTYLSIVDTPTPNHFSHRIIEATPSTQTNNYERNHTSQGSVGHAFFCLGDKLIHRIVRK